MAPGRGGHARAAGVDHRARLRARAAVQRVAGAAGGTALGRVIPAGQRAALRHREGLRSHPGGERSLSRTQPLAVPATPCRPAALRLLPDPHAPRRLCCPPASPRRRRCCSVQALRGRTPRIRGEGSRRTCPLPGSASCLAPPQAGRRWRRGSRAAALQRRCIFRACIAPRPPGPCRSPRHSCAREGWVGRGAVAGGGCGGASRGRHCCPGTSPTLSEAGART